MSNNREVAFEGTSWFYTYEQHRSVADIERDPSVGVSYQGKAGILGVVGKPGMFIHVEAEARLVRDKAAFAEHWDKEPRPLVSAGRRYAGHGADRDHGQAHPLLGWHGGRRGQAAGDGRCLTIRCRRARGRSCASCWLCYIWWPGGFTLPHPAPFLRIMPDLVPFPAEVVRVTGFAELAGRGSLGAAMVRAAAPGGRRRTGALRAVRVAGQREPFRHGHGPAGSRLGTGIPCPAHDRAAAADLAGAVDRRCDRMAVAPPARLALSPRHRPCRRRRR